MPKKFIERFARIDYLISKKATGSPSDLAERLEISESTLFEFLSVMKDLGAPIKFDKNRNSYYYESSGRFFIKFFENI
jgi:predicted DNA-binding transcriptional regulator YafY